MALSITDSDLQVTFSPEGWQGAGRRMLVLDSSFNPPTRAHQALVHATVAHFGARFFDCCLLLFTTRNVDKVNPTGATVDERLEMMSIVAGTLCSSEITTAVASTPHGKFVDKAAAVTSQWPGCTPYFIMGYDTVVRFLDPKYYAPTPLDDALAPFFQHAQLVCADRPGYGDIDAFWQACVYKGRMARVVLSDPAIADLSSTLARQQAAADPDRLESTVAPEVAAYIRSKQLYNK